MRIAVEAIAGKRVESTMRKTTKLMDKLVKETG